jgi:hypothetical protein
MRWRTRAGAGVLIFLTAVLAAQSAVARGPVVAVQAKDGQFFDQAVADQIKKLPQVVNTERFLVVRSQPNDVIGIEPGAALRIPSSDGKLLEASIERGRQFREGDKNAALVGPTVYREDYGFKPPMAGMMHGHPFEPGSSFTFPDSNERIRVVGTFSVEPEAESKRVLLPLATAQRLFGADGKLTHLFVEVDKSENLAQVVKAVRKTVGEKADIVSQ